jgi:hypothetical protein
MTDERCTEQRRDGSLLDQRAYAAIYLFELAADARQLLTRVLQTLWFDEILKLSCHRRMPAISVRVDQTE